MSKNKLKKFSEMETYEHVFQLSFNELREGASFENKGKWNSVVFKNDNPIVLELGCGRGEYTVGLARKNSNKNFIGIDIKGARMWTGATEAKNENLKNVAFLRTKIEMLSHFFAPNEVSEIWITFPDPQMKKFTKRMTSSAFLKMYTEILTDNGKIHLKTDSNFLFTYTSEILKANQILPIISDNNIYGKENLSDDLQIKTYYEQQWLARKIDIKYLQFSLPKNKDFFEPNVEIQFDEYRSYNREKRSELDFGK